MDKLLSDLGIEPRPDSILDGLCFGNNLLFNKEIVTVIGFSVDWFGYKTALGEIRSIHVGNIKLKKIPITKERLIMLGLAPDDTDLCPRYYSMGELKVVEDYKKVLDKNGNYLGDHLDQYDYYTCITGKWFKLDSISHLQNIARNLYGLDLSLSE